jgi:beta-glucanase (GH16 family)
MGWEKRITAVGLIFAPLTAYAVPSGVGPVVWSDEFNDASIDPAKWQVNEPGVWDGATNTSSAASVGNGAMKITTYTLNGTHYNAVMGTQDTQLFKYGYFEARIQFNSTQGMWSAFWLMSPTMGDILGDPGASGTEIDIAEHRAINEELLSRQSHFLTAVHWDGYGTNAQAVTQLNGAFAGLTPGTWHTYGLLWTPTSYKWYFDDQLIWTQTTAHSHADEYILLSSEIGNPWAGPILSDYGSLATSTTNVMIDYVHVSSLPEPGLASVMAAGSVALLRRRRTV